MATRSRDRVPPRHCVGELPHDRVVPPIQLVDRQGDEHLARLIEREVVFCGEVPHRLSQVGLRAELDRGLSLRLLLPLSAHKFLLVPGLTTTSKGYTMYNNVIARPCQGDGGRRKGKVRGPDDERA